MLIAILFSPYLLWLFYLAVMNLKRAYAAGRLSLPAAVFGYPLLLLGAAVDVLVNLTLCSVLFVEAPREWLVTTRLKRHLASAGKNPDWRARVAGWVCRSLLDAFDPDGCHCA